MIDFDVEPEFQKQVDWVEKFAKEEIEPLDSFLSIGRSKTGSVSAAMAGRRFGSSLMI